MSAILLLVLAASDLSGHVNDYLKAEPGSEAEAAAFAAIEPYWKADHEAVEEAIRGQVAFPPFPERPQTVKIPLPGLDDEKAPKENQVVVRVPKGYDPAKKWGLLLLVHGTGGFADQEVRTLAPFADEHGLILLAPQDELRRGGGGWGYTDYEHAIHREAVLALRRRVNLDDDRVFVSGGSRGGHASWDLAFTYPDVFAGTIPIVGAPKLRYFRYLPNLLHVPVFDMQGVRDDPILVEFLRDAIARLRKWDYDVTFKEDPESGHYYPVDWAEVWDWMKDRRRPTYPKRVILVATRNDRAHSYWIGAERLKEKRFAKPKPAVAPAGKPLTREEQIELVVDNYDKYRARIEGKIEGNEVDLTVDEAPHVTVWLSDRLVNLDERVEIRVNGRSRKKAKIARSLETLLSRVKATGEREMLFSAKVEVRGD